MICTFHGSVVGGKHFGHTLGFPTANQRKPEVVLPVEGVYATRATLEGHAWPAVTCVGRKPTFGDNELGVETFLLEDGKNLYGQMMRLEFVGRVRGEERFASVDALKQRIAQDVKDARSLLAQAAF